MLALYVCPTFALPSDGDILPIIGGRAVEAIIDMPQSAKEKLFQGIGKDVGPRSQRGPLENAKSRKISPITRGYLWVSYPHRTPEIAGLMMRFPLRRPYFLGETWHWGVPLACHLKGQIVGNPPTLQRETFKTYNG